MATADTATETANPPSGPATPLQQIQQRLSDMDQRQRLALGGVIAIVIALIASAMLWTRAPDHAVLFANLDERDGGEIVSALQQQNIPYRISADGRAIMIPSGQVHDVRLRLAAQGLPRGGLVGFEVMENQRLGASQFLEQVNYQRALEGELSRTVQSIAQVSNARVHLAIPRQSGFLRDNQRPSASVMVTMYPGRSLDPVQLAGIVHLVSSSVPQMSNEAVSVIDQNGTLLTRHGDPLRHSDLDATQLNYVREIENAYIRRIETILGPMLGRDNFRAQVTADVDFSQIEETAESFKPNPTPDQAIRSQQTHEQVGSVLGPGGVPGALTNQPPVPATAPIVDPDPNGGDGEGGTPLNRQRSATLNYELDRNIQHIRHATGQVRRLSVAVVVNERSETLPTGQTRNVPLSEAENERITNLVREAMGFNPTRGDSLNVSSAPFAEIDDDAIDALPLWQDPEIVALAKEVLKYGALALLLLFIYLAIIRPMMRTAFPPPAPAEPSAASGEGDEEGDEDAIVQLGGSRAPTFDERVAHARELAQNDPKAVAALVKEWLAGNEENKK